MYFPSNQKPYRQLPYQQQLMQQYLPKKMKYPIQHGYPYIQGFKNGPPMPPMPMGPVQPRPPFPGILAHFQQEDGKLDFDKMFTTANQIGNTVKQFGPILQLFKSK